MITKIFLVFILVIALSAPQAIAQALPDSGGVAINTGQVGLPPLAPKIGMATMQIQGEMDAEPTKGAPFCATVTTEHTQTFADGNRIHTADNSTLCRDSEGRTRREASLNLLGAAAQNSAPKLVTIVDPVAGFRYLLDTERKIAHKMPIGPALKMTRDTGVPAGPESGEHVFFYQRIGTAGPNIAVNDNAVFRKAGQDPNAPAPTTENLGDQTIEGIHATGTRVTTTIPTGEMGNEQPILVTSERWYSPELRATVMTKHDDPWAGELKTQLTNVNTSEPDPSLFAVPSDYKIVSEKDGPFLIQKHVQAPPSE